MLVSELTTAGTPTKHCEGTCPTKRHQAYEALFGAGTSGSKALLLNINGACGLVL